jgi:hypothetical protein
MWDVEDYVGLPNSTLGTRIAAAILRYHVKTSLSLFDNNSE